MTEHNSKSMGFFNISFHWQVLIGIISGVVLGYVSHIAGQRDYKWEIEIFSLFGGLFMNGLKMLVVPLVMLSIISSMASLGQQKGFARMGFKTIMFYASTSFFAIITGLVLVNLIQPGKSAGISAEEAKQAVAVEGSVEAKQLAKLKSKTDGKDNSDMLNVFKELIPKNIIHAMSHQKMLGLIVFSLIFGYLVTQLEQGQREQLSGLFDSLYNVMIKMTFLVIKFLPFGVMFLIAKTSSETFSNGNAMESLKQLSLFAITVLCALAIHGFVVLPMYLLFFAKVNPVHHFKAVGQAVLTAFSTASSASTLPMTMQCVENNVKVSKRVGGFVLPVGATVNMDGTALYECVAVMFLAQLSGISLDASAQFTIVLLALLTSIGVAGVPSARLVAIVIILNAVNDLLPAGQTIPIDTLAKIMIFDRLLDMCRTSINVLGDTVGASVIAKSEGEKILESS
jgi:proton glutamate symport protein